AVERWRTDLVDRMARLAEQHGLEGPFVRVGEQAGRIFWRDARGAEYGLMIVRLRELLRDPRQLAVFPEPRTRAALPPERDLRPDGAPARRGRSRRGRYPTFGWRGLARSSSRRAPASSPNARSTRPSRKWATASWLSSALAFSRCVRAAFGSDGR